MTSKVIIPTLPSCYRLDDNNSYDTWTERSMIHEIPTSQNTNLNGNTMISFDYKGEDYVRLGSPKSGFKVRARFLTHTAAPTAAAPARDRTADVTLEANWFHHLWSKYEIKAGSESLELIDYPGVATDIICHLKGLDYRQKSGEVNGFIPDEGTGDTVSGVANPANIANPAAADAAAIAATANAAADNAAAAVNAALRGGMNNGYLRRKLVYNYTVLANDVYRYVEVFIPLNLMFGFCEHYDKITKYMPYRVELTPRADKNNIMYGTGTNTMTFELEELTLHIDTYDPKPELKLTLDKRYEAAPLDINYLKRNIGTVDSNTQVTRISETRFTHPRYVFIVAKGTTGAANQDGVAANYSLCRNCNIEDIRVSLDSRWYPDKRYHARFDENKFSQYYDTFANICEMMSGSCGLTPKEFKDLYTIFCIDLSDQKDKLPNATTTLNIEIYRRALPADNATAINPLNVRYYYLILDEAQYLMDCKKKTAVKV